MIPARRAVLRLVYNGVDISADISEDLDSATWTDNSAKTADTLNVVLRNTHGRWIDDWFPSKGAKLSASIEVRDWGAQGNHAVLPCGTFEIDEIEVSGGATTKSIATIKAVSTPVTSALRGAGRTQAWQDIKLSAIAAEMANRSGLKLYYEMPADPQYQYEEQSEETDLNFLQGLCDDAGASLKVTHDRIVVFDQAEKEKEAAVITVTPGMVDSWKFKTKSNKVYSSVKVEYHDPETDEDYSVEVAAEPADLGGEDRNGRTQIVNQRCKSLAEAETLAKNALRGANKSEVTGTITSIGDVRLVAGVNVQISGFGRFDGKYTVETATHKIGGGYSVTISIRRAMGAEGAKKNGPEAGWKDYTAYGEELYRE